MANLNNIPFSCEEVFQSLHPAPAKMLHLAFTSSRKCQWFTGIQLSWKDGQADRAVSPSVCCAALKLLPQRDLCNLLCISLSCNSVVSALCGACHAVMSAVQLCALMLTELLASALSSTLHTLANARQAIRKAVVRGALLIGCSFRFKRGVLAEFQIS